MHQRVPWIVMPIAFAATFALGSATASGAEPTPWDAAKVTTITEQLTSDAVNLYNVFYQQPPTTIGSGQSRQYQELKYKTRRIKNEAKHIAAAVSDGGGHDETFHSFEDLMMLVRDARVLARQIFVSDQLQAAADKTRQTLNELAPYYGADPLAPIERR